MQKQQGYQVYSYRWIVLAAFMFINLTIQILWISYAAITGPAAQYYGVGDLEIGLFFTAGAAHGTHPSRRLARALPWIARPIQAARYRTEWPIHALGINLDPKCPGG